MRSGSPKQIAPGRVPRSAASRGEPPTLASLLCEATSHALMLIDHHGWIREVLGPAHLFEPARPDDLLGRRLSAFLYRGDRLRVDRAVARLFPDPGAVRQLTVRRRATGATWKAVELTLVNHMDVPDVAGLLAIFTEPADGNLTSAILGALREGVVLLDESGRALAASPAAERILGSSAEELIRRPLHEILGDDLAPAVAGGDGFAAPPWTRSVTLRRPGHSPVELRVQGHRVAPPARLHGQFTRQIVTVSESPAPARMEPGSRDGAAGALRDATTGLPSEPLLLDRLEQALARARRDATQLAVIRFEIPALAEVRQSSGQEAHDEVLRAMVQSALAVTRASDTLARLPDDTLCQVSFPVDDLEHASIIAARLAQRLDPTQLGNTAAPRAAVAVRTGIALSTGGESTPSELLTAAAEALARNSAALAQAGGPVLENPSAPRTAKDQKAPTRIVARELRRAVERQEFVVHLQPEVRLRDGRICGARVVPSCLGAHGGLLATTDVASLADSLGLTVAIGNTLLEHACWHAADLRRRHPDRTVPLRLGVSSRQLAQLDFARVVQRALARSGAEPPQLSLIATEEALRSAAGGDVPVRLLGELHDIGIRLTLAGFGGAGSHVDFLRSADVEAVELDPALLASARVRGPKAPSRDLALPGAVLAFASALGLTTIAGGVQTAAQVASLKRLGCQIGVGAALGTPLTPERLGDALAGHVLLRQARRTTRS